MLLHTRRSAGGISSVSAFTKPSAAVRDQAEPGTRAAIPSVLHQVRKAACRQHEPDGREERLEEDAHFQNFELTRSFRFAFVQRGLVLLLECIRGFAVALQRSTLVLPFSHQLPPPQSLCLPLVAGDDAAARGADFSQSSPQTPNAPAATAVSPEVYVQLLHSADASSRSASASGDALGCVFHKEHLPLDGVFTSDGKGASCVGSGGGSFRPNPLSCCVPPLTMRAGMLGKNLLGSRSRGATGLSSLAAPSEFSVGAHSHGHPREEEEDSGSSTLTVQWVRTTDASPRRGRKHTLHLRGEKDPGVLNETHARGLCVSGCCCAAQFGATLQQLTSAIKVLQRALELGQRLEDEKVVCVSPPCHLLVMAVSLPAAIFLRIGAAAAHCVLCLTQTTNDTTERQLARKRRVDFSYFFAWGLPCSFSLPAASAWSLSPLRFSLKTKSSCRARQPDRTRICLCQRLPSQGECSEQARPCKKALRDASGGGRPLSGQVLLFTFCVFSSAEAERLRLFPWPASPFPRARRRQMYFIDNG